MLLLEDLIKQTWTEHPDYAEICKAKAKIGAVLKLLNEQKKKTNETIRTSYVYSLIAGLTDTNEVTPLRQCLFFRMF